MYDRKIRTRRVTIKDIAAEAGVSIALVSFVMNNQANGRETYRVNKNTAKRILEVAQRLNYRPNNAARTLRCGRTNTIGVIVSDISNKFFADIARCIEDRAYKYNYTVLFGSTDEKAAKLDRLIDVFLNKGIDGLIIVPCEDSGHSIHHAAEREIPLVLLDRDVEEANLSCVLLDNFKAGAQATESLLARGCKKIEMISYAMRLSNVRDREAGYNMSMTKAGLQDISAIHTVYHEELDRLNYIIEDAKKRKVEGLLFATNTLAVTGLKEINRHGWRIPDDFAVATFDGSEAFEINSTDIAYVQQPIMQFGTEAVDMLIKQIDQKGEKLSPARIILAPKLIENGESAHRTLATMAE